MSESEITVVESFNNDMIKYVELNKKINEIPEFKSYLLDENIKYNHLQKCVMRTSTFKILEDYIDVYLSFYPESINEQDEKGCTALLLACICANRNSTERTVEILLKHKPKVNIQDKDGRTALMYASKYSRMDSSLKVIELLLDYGADINSQDKNGWTALMHTVKAVQNRSTIKTVELLLSRYPDINLKNNHGTTALMIASKHSRLDSSERTVEILLENNADVDLQNKNGMTALMFSTLCCGTTSTERTIRLLLEYNSNVNLKNKEDLTALKISILEFKKSTQGATRILLEKTDNADIKIGNIKLINHLWKLKYSDDIISLALQKGAKISDLRTRCYCYIC